MVASFIPLFTYKALKLDEETWYVGQGFIPLFTYKALKQALHVNVTNQSFIPLFTYKALKLCGAGGDLITVLYLYLLTRLSNLKFIMRSSPSLYILAYV